MVASRLPRVKAEVRNQPPRASLARVHPLYARILRFMEDRSTTAFETLALAIFEYQFESCEPYRRFCLARQRRPGEVDDWRDIPAVPIQAFKHATLCCGEAERVFLSTGTTAGPAGRSRHFVPDLSLYRRSAGLGLRRFLFPDVERIRLLSLIPTAAARPESSLAQMVAWAFEQFGDSASAYAVDGSGIDLDRLVGALRDAEASGAPLCIFSTTGALLRLLDLLRERDLGFRLPHGSRVMDTGGDKGAPRRISRNGLLHACWNAFAIPGYFCVNEYGMAELSSQYYDSVIADRFTGRHRARRKVGPHWLRTLVIDPDSLRPCPPGQPGLLCHLDLANAGSAMAVLSEDLGVAEDEGLRLLGRMPGAESRGCSMSVLEWTAATVS
jgi:hypothetical protein